jgi:hypothetical protein
MATQSLSGDPQHNELQEQMARLLAMLCGLFVPRGLNPEATRRWARAIVYSTLFVAATTFAVLFAGGLAVILAPDRSHLLKWPGVVFLSLLGWRFAHFFPQVWQNRRDDKFAVLFIAFLIATWAYMIGRILVG